jgi:hypothetical protein
VDRGERATSVRRMPVEEGWTRVELETSTGACCCSPLARPLPCTLSG